MKMNQRVKDLWTAALRSGKYAQGRQRLHLRRTDGSDDPDQFCCLGVLCDLALQEGIVVREPTLESGYCYVYYSPGDGAHGEVSVLPRAVMEWAGLDWNNPPVLNSDLARVSSLASLNDHGTPFPVIADLIEEYL